MESGRQKIFQTPRNFANVSCKINIKKFNTLNSVREINFAMSTLNNRIITIRKMYVLVKTTVLLKALLSKLCFVFHKVKHE